MDNRSILLGLHELPGIGWKTVRDLASRFSDLTEITGLKEEDFLTLGLQENKAKTLARLDHASIKQRMACYESKGIRILTVFDEEYPELLRRTSQPPWILYCIGNLSLLAHPCIAVVGTRTPTAYGRKVAEDLSADLSAMGFCVASGLARGIDGCAHQGALRERGGTIAVLAGAVDQVYPPENAALYRTIAERGLIVSEMPSGTPIRPGLFPLRNRVIAGLALGTVVVEAASRSGSLITADLALEESRDVFAVPGPVTSPKSQGALALIRQGAKMAACAEDIAEEYKHLISRQKGTYIIDDRHMTALTDDERTVLALLSPIPATIDSLLEACGFEFGHLHAILLSLLVKRKIAQLPGSVYVTI